MLDFLHAVQQTLNSNSLYVFDCAQGDVFQLNVCMPVYYTESVEFLSRHRSAETQCWMRRYVRTYVRGTYVRGGTSLFAMRPRKCCMHALHP